MGPTDAKGGAGGALQNYSREAGGVDRERSLFEMMLFLCY